MKKLTLFLFGFLLFGFISQAQNDADTAWKTGADFSLMFSQTSFTNWAQGGENNLTINGFADFYARYEKGKVKWENMLSLAYGQTKTGKQDFRKNEDKIDLLSAYGIKASDKWYYTANFNFKSQFAEGFDYHDDDTLKPQKISNFLAPAYISLGLGMEYRPKDYFSIYMSPATARWIIVNDQDLADAGAFGVEKAYIDDNGTFIHGETSKFELGAYLRFMFVKDIVKNVNLSTKLELFSDYLNNPQNIDVNWDTKINMTINSWLMASFGLQMVYDDDTPITDKDGNTGPRTQIKQLLSVGLNYKFASK
ncbi:MAG: hypothetical protein B6D64_12125 [Bacteroidetes bacterium 4484_276]|nr:MAG: hypothetical protein B6D64_12125 [Bacteroidetes bacterium 4484_276]